ncbi:hypothetical protein TNCV_1964971 [Trichonephila clavipes]|nr:hypothetical protein TNCV_1964971 [Trichonephila clavipes]
MHHQRQRTSQNAPLSEKKSVPNSGSAEFPIRFRSKFIYFGKHISLDTVGCVAAQQTSQTSVDHTYIEHGRPEIGS